MSFGFSPSELSRPSLSARMARWGLVIVAVYALVAVVTPLLLAAGLLPDPNAQQKEVQ